MCRFYAAGTQIQESMVGCKVQAGQFENNNRERLDFLSYLLIIAIPVVMTKSIGDFVSKQVQSDDDIV